MAETPNNIKRTTPVLESLKAFQRKASRNAGIHGCAKKFLGYLALHLLADMIKYCKRRRARKIYGFVFRSMPINNDSPIDKILQDFQRGRERKMKISRLVVSAVSFAVSAALLTLSIIDLFQNDLY